MLAPMQRPGIDGIRSPLEPEEEEKQSENAKRHQNRPKLRFLRFDAGCFDRCRFRFGGRNGNAALSFTDNARYGFHRRLIVFRHNYVIYTRPLAMRTCDLINHKPNPRTPATRYVRIKRKFIARALIALNCQHFHGMTDALSPPYSSKMRALILLTGRALRGKCAAKSRICFGEASTGFLNPTHRIPSVHGGEDNDPA